MQSFGFYLILERLCQADITKRKTIYNMKLYEVFDYLLIENIKQEVEDLSKSNVDGKIYF